MRYNVESVGIADVIYEIGRYVVKAIEYNLIFLISQIMKLFYLHFVTGQIIVEYLKPLVVENNFVFFKTLYRYTPQAIFV